MEYSKLIFNFILLTFCQVTSGSRCGTDLQQRIYNQIFLNYNKFLRPPPGDVPTVVSSNVRILNIVSVDEKAHTWEVNLFLRHAWNDPRLQYANLLQGCPNFKSLALTDPEAIAKLWKPNLFFILTGIREKVHDVVDRNTLIRIAPNGDILYSVHVEVTHYCTGMDSKPGEFMCPMAVGGYGLTTDDLTLKWDPTPININKTEAVRLDDHVLGDIDTFLSTRTFVTGTYSQIQANFHFLRKACIY